MKINIKSWYKRLGFTGIALCGLCCVLPVIAMAAGFASLTVISIYLEKIGILLLGLAAFFYWYAWYHNRKEAKVCATSCDSNCGCKTKTSKH